MKHLVLMILLMSLANCRNNNHPTINNQEQLSPVFEYVIVDGKEYIDIESSRCNSRTYKISKEFVGPIDKAVKLNIKECNKIIGRATKEYATFATFLENMRRWLLTF